MWASFERQEYQARRAQRKSDPVAESDLVDVDVGYPDDSETRNRLFEAASLASLYTSGFWLRSRLYCFGRMSAPSSALASEPYRQQEEVAAAATSLPNTPPSWLLVEGPQCLSTDTTLSLERCGILRAYRGAGLCALRSAISVPI